MKIKFIFLLLVWCSFAPDNFAQKVIEPNKKWMYAIGQSYPTPEINHYDCLIIGGDSVIGSKEYYKLYNLYNCEYEISNLKGFIRETEDAKVYFLPFNEAQEWLLYDFGLNVGDSMYFNKGEYYMYLDSVGVDNTNRKIYYLSNQNNENLQWIEGIGSNIGLLMERIVGGFQVFTCCFRNEELVYQNPDFSTCYISSGTINSTYKIFKATFKLSFFPNPTNNQVTISNPAEIHIKKIELIDYSGRIIQIWNELELGMSTLNVQQFQPGVYILKAETNEGIKIEKLVVR